MISEPDRSWTQVQAWAYALGAPYNVQHEEPLDALPMSTTALQRDLAEMCARDWSIGSADDLVQTLDWLGREGHRVPNRLLIRRYCLMLRPALTARREELRRAGRDDPEALEELWRLDAVQADWHGVRGGVLLGFDAARAAMLARSGLVLGWLEPPAAWRYLTDMAADVQRSYGSWAEYAADYKLSRALWRAKDDFDLFDEITDRLLDSRESPWRKLPWAIPGLSLPRPGTPANASGPVWNLER